MLSIKEALEKDNNEDVVLQVKILQFLKAETSSTGKENRVYAMGDESRTSKVRVFKRNEFNKFDQQPSLVLLNVIKKQDYFILNGEEQSQLLQRSGSNYKEAFQHTNWCRCVPK